LNSGRRHEVHERQRGTAAQADALRAIGRAIGARDWPAAVQVSGRLTAEFPAFAAGWHAASRVALGRGLAPAALEAAERALSLEPGDARYLIQRGRCLLALGRFQGACEAAAEAQRRAPPDPLLFDSIGSLFTFGNDPQRAIAAYDEAVRLAPDNPLLLFNRATVRRFLGDLAGAESDYDRVIALKPADYEAYKNRSDLRLQTAERNHTAELERLAAQEIADWRGNVQIYYALAKEHEDLGHHDISFEWLRRGSRLRREHLRYDVANDVATVDWIIEAFPAAGAPAAGAPAAGPPAGGPPADGPIFIVGLPRTGTTLVDRILGSHSQIQSAGELNGFAHAVVDAVRRQSGKSQLPRQELIARSAMVDFGALGRDYLARAATAAAVSRRFTDKMPLNYLYCGLIRRALPNARIVHLNRHPMAACYAMYKTLFADGYPFSYDLGEIARYYVAYRRLMDHWQACMPDFILPLRYESLVADQWGETRRLLAFCGLDWEDACARFQDNPAPSMTASAAQVRRPLYDSSVAQWRHYEGQLRELAGLLEAAGIDLAGSAAPSSY
jgi:tetratricopeptide (TPR) repeat protein